jgi:hypothetical protein
MTNNQFLNHLCANTGEAPRFLPIIVIIVQESITCMIVKRMHYYCAKLRALLVICSVKVV